MRPSKTTPGQPASQWFVTPKPNPSARLRLFCFPYAGGSVHLFRRWPALLPPSVELCAAQLPGRGSRFKERPFTQMGRMTEAVGEGILPLLNKPFAFFGHSMGAMLSFELARWLRRTRGVEPSHLFVSGRRAPHIPGAEEATYDLPEEEFIEETARLNGTPAEVLENRELMTMMIPILRADFEVCQTYGYAPEPPLSCPITAFCGLQDDEEDSEVMKPWREQTTGAFSLRLVAGDHFFIHTAEEQILRVIAQQWS